EVLGRVPEIQVDDTLGADVLLCCGSYEISDRGVIEERGIADNDVHICTSAQGLRRVSRHAPNVVMGTESPLLVHRSECAFHPNPVRDDVRRPVRDQSSDRQDAWHVGWAMAADDRLQGYEDVRRDKRGIRLEAMWRGSVPAGAFHRDIYFVCGRHVHPASNTDRTCVEVGLYVLSKDHLWPRSVDLAQGAFVDHGFGAARQLLLARLKQETNGPRELVAEAAEDRGRPQEGRSVGIVPAGVHAAGIA